MAAFAKSIEYIEATMTGSTAVDTNLTKSQNFANCVPFYSVNLDVDVNDVVARRYVDVTLASGPKVTVKRSGSGGTAIAGVFALEIDTTGNVSVQQGTFTLTGTSTTEAITDVLDVTKAFVIIVYENSHTGDQGDDACVKVVFNSTTELGFARISSGGTVTGHYYVVVTSGTDFSVQHDQIAMAATDETATAAISAVTLASSFLIRSHTSEEPSDDVKNDGIVADISTTTAVRARRAFNDFGDTTADAASDAVATIETQVVSAGGTEFTVARAECNWGNSETKAVAISAIDQAKAIVIAGGYQGCMSSAEEGGGDVDGNYGLMNFTSDEEVTGTRGVNTSPDGTTMFEVPEFVLTAAAAANPKGPLGMPFHGPFGGPV